MYSCFIQRVIQEICPLHQIREWEDDIIYIEEDGWLHLQSEETSGNDTKEEKDKPKKKDGQPTEQWGLDRIDQRNVPLDGVFSVKRKERCRPSGTKL